MLLYCCCCCFPAISCIWHQVKISRRQLVPFYLSSKQTLELYNFKIWKKDSTVEFLYYKFRRTFKISSY